MKKIDLGQTISILANIGVIAGIVFLALELQQNNTLLSAQARSELANRRTGFIEMVINSQDLAEIVVKKAKNEPLTDAEDLRFRALGRRMFASWASQYQEVDQGVITQDMLPIRQWRALYHGQSDPDFGLREAWAGYRLEVTPSFNAFMDEVIIEPGPP